MGRLIQWNMLSLDGYFEGAKSWDVAWFSLFFNDGLEQFSIEQLRQADALLFGRVTYEGMAGYWKTAEGEDASLMNSLPKFVVSNTLEKADWTNTTLIKGNAIAEIRALKQQRAGAIFVFGSGKLSATLLDAGLFDEVRVCLEPIVIGRGATLFGRGLKQTQMKLLEARPLSNGCVVLRYQPQPIR